jgi:hypothetical protein
MVVFFFEQNDRIARALENYFAGKKPILFLEHIDIDFKQDWVGVTQTTRRTGDMESLLGLFLSIRSKPEPSNR